MRCRFVAGKNELGQLLFERTEILVECDDLTGDLGKNGVLEAA